MLHQQITPAQRETIPSIVRLIRAMPLHEQIQLLIDVSEGADFGQCDFQATVELESTLNRLKADAIYDLREQNEMVAIGTSRSGVWL